MTDERSYVKERLRMLDADAKAIAKQSGASAWSDLSERERAHYRELAMRKGR